MARSSGQPLSPSVNNMPLAKKYIGHLQKHIVSIFLCVFFLVTGSFIYNETQTPVYESSTVIHVNSSSSHPLPFEHIIHQHALLSMHADELLSENTLKKLAQHPSVASLRNDWPLKKSLSVSVQAETKTISITAKNSNPRVAHALAQNLPKVYEKMLLEKQIPSTDLAKQNEPQAYSQRDLSTLPARIHELNKILASSYKYLPAYIQDEKLVKTHNALVQKELELNKLKSHTSHFKSMLSEIGFLYAAFNRGLKEKIGEYQLALNRGQKTGTEKPAQISEAQQYQSYLNQDDSEKLMTGHTIEVISPAQFPVLPTYPKKLFNLALASVVGVVLGLIVVTLTSGKLPKSSFLSSPSPDTCR